MRNIFISELVNQAKKNPDIYLITGDLGYRSFEVFSSQFPDRFINCGVAENNMVGIGAGLALTGKKVFLYSIIPFLVFRSFEQIRNNITGDKIVEFLVFAHYKDFLGQIVYKFLGEFHSSRDRSTEHCHVYIRKNTRVNLS